MSDPLISFTGWVRSQQPRARWKRYCRAATEEACLKQMLDAPHLNGWDKLTRQGDANPNEDKEK